MYQILYLILPVTHVFGYVPNYDIWTESSFNHGTKGSRKTDNSLERLTAVREVLKANKIDAYLVPTSDAHNSEYIAPSDARREWLSGLSGSSGTALVTSDRALLWTDSRYYTQFEMEVNTTYWTLMKETDASIEDWLVHNLKVNTTVGIDPTTYTHNSWLSLQMALEKAGISLEATPVNFIDAARVNLGDDPPKRPNNPLMPLPLQFSGRNSSDKIEELLTLMKSREATALILTALDDVAYTLNIRGSDIPFNPVFFSYLIIRNDLSAPNNLVLLWSNGSLTDDISEHLASEGLQIDTQPYEKVFEYLSSFVGNLTEESVIWLSDTVSHALYLAANSGKATILTTGSPVANIKYVKNEVEILGFRNAHIKDGTAVVRALRKVEELVSAGENITEIDVSDIFEDFRRQEADFQGPSFGTIAGAGENAAIIHYSPPRDGSRVVGKNDMLLVDSGGQYKDGTTDITRTRHMSGSPTDEQRRAFTRVLKGLILLGSAVFPRGILGYRLESFARRALWDVGLDYAHGTGHGVGHFLNVHEAPSSVPFGITGPGIVEKMIFSNEPGYYEVGEYGIRHEDLVEVIAMDKNANHIMAKEIVGDFNGVGALGLYTISLVPHQTACLDVDLLTDFEIQYINEYHERVLKTIGPVLQDRNLTDDFEWLERECTPIRRSAAGIVTSTPLLPVFVGILSLFYAPLSLLPYYKP